MLKTARPSFRCASVLGLFCLVFAACAPRTPGESVSTSGAASQPMRPTVLRIASTLDPPEFHSKGRNLGGSNTIRALVNAGLANQDEKGVTHPYLLEQLPSRDDGTWIVNADGTMKTIMRLRPNLKWQDGQPLTAADLVFGHAAYTDPEIPFQDNLYERLMSQVVASDDRTLEISWRQIFSRAGSPTHEDLPPLPRHLLGDLFQQDKTAFVNSSYWTSEEFVHAGPYRIAQRNLGVALTLQANPHFVYGRPQIDAVEIKVVPDVNAVVAHLLSGEVDFVDVELGIKQAKVVKDHWETSNAGQVHTALNKIRRLQFQYRDVPNHQAALTDLRVRKALMHALDREALALSETEGFSTAADSFFSSDSSLWPRVEQAIAKYPYDPRQTEVLLREAGWIRGVDGMFQNPSGQLFDVEVRGSTQEPIIIADQWKQVGINGKPQAPVQSSDPQYKVSFPGTSLSGGTPGNYDVLSSVTLPTAANRFLGQNEGSYFNPQYDALAERFKRALTVAEQNDLAVQIERLISVDVATGPLFYQVRPAAARTGVKGIRGLNADMATYAFNIWEWRIE